MFRPVCDERFLTDAQGNQRQLRKRRAAGGASPYRRRLRIEPLEDRRLLATITVNTIVDEADGSIVDGDISLRDALAKSAASDTINFAASLTSGGPATINLTNLGELKITKILTINGPGASVLTIKAYNPSPTVGNGSRVFNVDDSTSTARAVAISDLTLTGGDVTSSGGAIRSLENLTVTNCTISGSVATGTGTNGYGGGIFSSGHTLVVNGCTIIGNSARYGGGIDCLNGNLTVTGSTISGNSATVADGGGILIDTCPTTITSSTISGNSAAGDGGGLLADNTTTVSITTSTISGNTGDGGGGINNGYSTMTVTDSTISGNQANSVGGGIFNDHGTLTVTDSTISGNQAKTGGGGIYADHGSITVTHSTITGNRADSDNNGSGLGGGFLDVSATTRAFHSTIIAGNTRGAATRSDKSGLIELQYSLLGDPSDPSNATVTNTGGNLIGTATVPINPLLGPLANNGGPTLTHALLAGSPAIDAGNAGAVVGMGGVPQYDQRGTPNGRIADGDGVGGARIDIGAFEVQPNHSPTTPAAVALAAINEDTPNASNAGTLVSAIVTASGSTDSDGNSLGIAVTAADNSHGQWQYSTNGGAAWQDLSSVSTASARLLAPAYLVRFVPSADFNSQVGASPTIGFKVWDQTSGAAGSTADTTSNSAYSTSAAQATQTVTPINDEQVLATNNPLTLDRGASAAFTAAFLATTDVDDAPSELAYTVTSSPTHGTLLVGGTSVGQFTQQQISAGLVSYQHDGTATLADSFGFTVDDGEGTTSSGTFQITIRPYAGDYNGNRTVDAADYVLWRRTLGTTGVTVYSGADGDGDTTIDADDYGVWRGNFGNTLPAGAGSGSSVEGGVGSGEGVSASAVASAETPAGPVALAGKISALTAPVVLNSLSGAANSGARGRAGGIGGRPAGADASRRDDALVAWLCARDSGSWENATEAQVVADRRGCPSHDAAVDGAIDALDAELQTLLV